MKKIIALLLCLVFLAGAVPAMAYNDRTSSSVPPEVDEYFRKDTYKDYTMTSIVEVDNYCFAMMKAGKSNVLYGFKLSNNKYKYWMRTDSAIAQGPNEAWVSSAGRGFNPNNGRAFKNESIVLVYGTPNGSTSVEAVYSLMNGIWTLRYYGNNDTGASISVSADGLSYYDIKTHKFKGTAEGTYETDLRYTAVTIIPQTLAKARTKLTTAPSLPGSDILEAEKVKFTGGKTFKVFSGPGTDYFFGVSKKGRQSAVSTNDWIQVFGEEDGWIMIHYSISSDHYRFGWIDASALPKNKTVRTLNFNASAAVIVKDVSLTDDPLYSRTALTTLPADSEVTWLATLGDWAYVETFTTQPIRGFVPLSAIHATEDTAPVSEDDDLNG